MSEREAGYYWVRHWQFHDWHIAEKTLGGGWLLTGMAMPYDDDDMEEVGPLIPTPDEPWATVPVKATPEMVDAVFWAQGQTDVAAVWIDMLSSAPDP